MSGGVANGLRVAIVEDEALVAMLMEDALTSIGHHVSGIADSYRDAVALVERDTPDLVLCDVKLLGGDSGLDVAAYLAAKNIPCLFVSGNCPSPEEGRDLAMGCILKPFSTAGLEEAVEIARAVRRGERPKGVPNGMTLYR